MEARTGIEGLDTLLRIAFTREDLPRCGEPDGAAGECHWESTLGLVERAAQTLQSAEERIRDLEARHQEVIRVTALQIDAAHARVASAETRAQEAENRAYEAEESARVNREWLARVRSGLQHLPATR